MRHMWHGGFLFYLSSLNPPQTPPLIKEGLHVNLNASRKSSFAKGGFRGDLLLSNYLGSWLNVFNILLIRLVYGNKYCY